ncbi:hypothetical protein [Viridibacillus arvi]|uniref:hypothetical protein n=1 Tax=Viridibacillus arvi TaxID=263475 RepID=UPI0034CD951B
MTKIGALFFNALFLMGLIALTVVNSSTTVFASEFDVNQHNAYVDYQNGQKGQLADNPLLADIQNGGNTMLASIVNIGFDILALLFIFGVIGIAAGFTLQNGQWTKWSTGAMYGTFLAIIFLRILPIIVLTIDQIGITLVINHIIQLFSSVGFFISVMMFLIGLFLRSLNKIFEHPKYFRWSRSLMFGSLIIVILSTISPIVIMSL